MRKGLLFALLMASSMLSFGQSDISNKLSISTQMFIDERDGALELKRNVDAEKRLGLEFVGKRLKANKNDDRIYAAPDTIDGRAYISAFIRLDNNADVKTLTNKGVRIQSSFDNGLYTALIPVNSIEEVARLSNVKRINVSMLMRPFTNNARSASNVDDVLTKSADAVALGLSQKYDGTGVVLGVIDTGIDFQHIAFKDASGNSRIKRAYVYNGSSAKEYTSITSSSPTTDDKSEDHGTHTSSTAGGSSVIISGSNVTVTNDHANATYGGMAPGADLYLAGVNGLSSTYMANAFQKICDYADAQGKPVVISNSWGSQYGPHDGTGDFADITAQYFGSNHPNHVCLFAASNDGGKSKDGEGGGYHVSGTASSSSPLGSILRAASYSNTDAGYYYYGIIANAWSRSRLSSGSLACKIFVLDSSTGAVKTSVTVTPSTSGASVSGLSSYFSGTLYAYKDYVSSNKSQIMLYTSGLTSRSYTTTTKNGSTYYKSKYTLAVQFYPTSGSCTIDAWGGSYGYFTNHLSTSGYTWTNGSDDMCVSDEATDPNVISIGAYVTANTWKAYNGSSYSMSDVYTVGDIAYFSSYATANQSPTGIQYPWITAPGARLAAGVNHYHTASVDDYSYYGSNYNSDLVVNNSSSPYAMMEGTSMATPVAAGIVALWLQAAKESGQSLTNSDIKNIMKQTAIKDSYTTTGANASHFGNGKINALAGLQQILGSTPGTVVTTPVITASASSLAFSGTVGQTYTKTFTVSGADLEGAITATISGSNCYTVSPSSISKASATSGATVTVTYAPTAAGNTSATLTLSSSNAQSVTISLSGSAAAAAVPVITASASSLSFSANAGETQTKSVTISGSDLTGAITVAVSGSAFSVNTTSISNTQAAAGKAVNVTFTAPATAGSYSGTLTLTSASAAAVTIALAGTSVAQQQPDPEPTTTKEVYKLVSSVSSGKQYVIVNKNTVGSANAITTNSSHTVANSSVNIVSGNDGSGNTIKYIEEPSSYAVWTCGTSSSSKTFKNGSYYLYHKNNKLSMNTSTTNAKWTVGSNAASLYYSSGGYKYLAYSSGWTITSSSTSVYFFEKTTITVPGEGGGDDPVVPDPALSVSKSSLSFSTEEGTPVSQTFTLTGANLTQNVSVSLTGGNGAFAVSPSTVSASAAQAGATITVTFSPAAAGNYNGSITFTSGSASASVTLSGSATAIPEPEPEPAGGTASDSYLNLHKYSTISDAGYSGVNALYAYTEKSDGSAWVTVPAYGAYSSSSYQGWISYSSNSTVRTTWSSYDVFKGYSNWFSKSSQSRAITSSSSGTATQNYFVSNLTAVKVYGYNPSSWFGSSNTSTTINVYECTVSSNGSVSASSSVVATGSYSTTGNSFVITIDNLDASKVYKVEVSVKKSYFYEIAFQTTQSAIDGNSNFNDWGTLGIGTINADEDETRIYTIHGQYVGNDIQSLEKGMYIINGKKVMIK
ncbi:MAG: S8 family serine peptidase [Bacteroidales bacterium]|nr:S8 family serine peptidase [Bacteroidales bacterium]